MPTNHERAGRVVPLLDLYRRIPGLYRGGIATNDPSLFVDIVTDVLHCAHGEGIDADEILRLAESNFEGELDGDQFDPRF